MIQGIREIHVERANEYMALSRKKYESAIRPIYGLIRSGVAPKHIGSCVLISVSDTRLLVTAGHVTDYLKQVSLHVAGTKELVPLSFDAGFTTNPERRRDEDPYDFSVCAISDNMQRELGDVRYITEQEIYKARPLGRHRLFMVTGYPTSKNKKGVNNPGRHITGTLWTFAGREVADPYAAPILDAPSSENRIFVEFDHKLSLDRDGIGTHSITPTGASGGALFDLGKLDDPERLAKPARCEAKLVGILIEYRSPNKVIVATSMKLVLEAVRQNICNDRGPAA